MVHSDALSGHGQGTPEGWTEASDDSDPGASKDMTASWTAPSDFQTSPETSLNLAPLSAVSASDPSILVLLDPEPASITSSEALGLSHAPPKEIRLSELLAQSDALMRQYPPSSLKPEELMGPRGEAADEEDDDEEWMWRDRRWSCGRLLAQCVLRLKSSSVFGSSMSICSPVSRSNQVLEISWGGAKWKGDLNFPSAVSIGVSLYYVLVTIHPEKVVEHGDLHR
jgi:hypothetical protein